MTGSKTSFLSINALLASFQNVHITESSFIVFSVLKNEKFGKDFGPIAITIYCSCYAMMLSLLSIHFFYRYTSVTAPMWLSNRFSSKSSIFWFLFVFVYSTIWGCSSYFLCKPTENKDRELLREFMKEYCMKPEEYAYVGPQYFYENFENGKFKFHWPSFLGIGILASQMSSTFVLVVFFGVKTYQTLVDKTGNNCFASRELQKQLFKTLIIQTIIPSIFMYFPVSCMFLFPIFGLKVEAMANLIPISVSVYPCLEPLVALIFIRDLRNRIVD
ncbi:Protein CBG18637 [Caenorhabditis briggsae]|uniref:Serpentine receptor class r-10 n=1 Tax=Caenorhabditis briggsae TaxID=6238 RepID=A8XTS3_CAEBR|nr:Protein CBG18637 [Caenorhabditis briggsae]CAP36049.1 Protein CBG18637 [Caenorhabditis briggsae]